jgi:Tfp pilus assembly protein PilO
MAGRWKKNMAIKLTAQKKWIIAIIAVILINVAVWFYGLSPAMEKLKAAQAELSSRQGERDSLKKRVDELNAIDTVALELELEAHRIRIPQLGLVREFITELEKVAITERLIVERLSIAEPSAREQFLITSISLNLAGQYSSMVKYLTFLENHTRLVLVDSINFSAGADGILKCTIDLEIFAENFNPITPYKAPGRVNPFRL